MLKLALVYKDKLLKEYQNIIYDDHFKYYNCSSYWEIPKIDESTWNNIQLVSVDKNDNVIGYLTANIDRECNYINGLGIASFNGLNITFSKDLYQFLIDLFLKYGFNKISFKVVLGNPAEKMYDKYIKKYGGRIIRVRLRHNRLQDGNFYDEKLYEIFKDDFLRHYKR